MQQLLKEQQFGEAVLNTKPVNVHLLRALWYTT